MLDVAVRYEEAEATVRYQFGKVRLDQILERYDGTRFTVSRFGPITAVVRQKNLTVRSWADPPELPAESTPSSVALLVELIPASEYRLASDPSLALHEKPPLEGLRLVREAREIERSNATGSIPSDGRRFGLEIAPGDALPPGEVSVPMEFRYTLRDKAGKDSSAEGAVEVPLLIGDSEQQAAGVETPAGLALVGGAFHVGWGHLCDQKGCKEHLHEALSAVPGLIGLRPTPNLESPEARLFVRASQPLNVWELRERLRDRGVETSRLVAEEFGPFVLSIELPRWRSDEPDGQVSQCAECRELAMRAAGSLAWTERVEDGSNGQLIVRLRDGEARPDLAELLDALLRAGVAPSAVWLVPDGVAMPEPAGPRAAKRTASPRLGGSEAHPLIQLDLGHLCPAGPGTLDLLGTQKWASRTGLAQSDLGAIASARVLGTPTAVAAVGDRKYAELTPLLRELRAAGRSTNQITLSDFGELRIECEFAHICGEVEYSKPPKKKKEKDKKTESSKEGEQSGSESDEGASEGEKDKKQTKKQEKPFVPKPIRPAASSNGRKAIERAAASVPWIKEAVYRDYHTKPEFKSPRKLFVAFETDPQQLVRLDQLLQALMRAGFPPTRVRVSSLFAGMPFGFPLPSDLELVDHSGEPQLLSSFRQPSRPFVVAFVSLNCPKWDKYKYEADPALYEQLKKTIDEFGNQADFLAISSNADDEFDEVDSFLKEAGLSVPLLRDPEGHVRAVFNAQITPAPHLHVFDGDGLLRYAGDAHDHWNEPEEAKEDYLSRALKLVLASKFKDNGAVFYNKSVCNCSSPHCKCPKCGCGSSCRCAIKHCKVGF